MKNGLIKIKCPSCNKTHICCAIDTIKGLSLTPLNHKTVKTIQKALK